MSKSSRPTSKRGKQVRRPERSAEEFSVQDGAFDRLWKEGWRFPLRLHRARSRFGWSQADLARAAGLREQTVSDLLSGKRQASFAAAGALIRAFHFAPAWQLHLIMSLVETGLELGGVERDGQRIEDNLAMERGTGELNIGRGNWAGLKLRQWAVPAVLRPTFPDAEIPLKAPDAELEDWHTEFERITKVAGRGYFSSPSWIRNEDARRQYVERVLRPFSRVLPPAAWVLAYSLHERIGNLDYRERSVWSIYRTVRRGKFPVDEYMPLRHEAILSSPRKRPTYLDGTMVGIDCCIDCGRKLPKLQTTHRCDRCAKSERLSKPRRVDPSAKPVIPDRRITSAEHLAILNWDFGRQWNFPGNPVVDQEVDALMHAGAAEETALSEGHRWIIENEYFRDPF